MILLRATIVVELFENGNGENETTTGSVPRGYAFPQIPLTQIPKGGSLLGLNQELPLKFPLDGAPWLET